MNKSTINIGKNLKRIRKMREVSLQKMAEETKMSYSYLSGLENDKHSISLTNLSRIADFLNVDVIKILEIDDRKPEFFESKTIDKVLSVHSGSAKNVDIYFVNLAPKQYFEEEKNSIENKEFRIIYVLNGNLNVMYDGIKTNISKGQGMKIAIDKEHILQSKTKDTTFIVIEC